MKIILIILFVCGNPDTFIVKHPDKAPVYVHGIYNVKVLQELKSIIKTEPIIIKYSDDREMCV